VTRVRVRVPATTANLGPGFDCLALSLDLWNEAVFSTEGDDLRITIRGEGQDRLPVNHTNTTVAAFRGFFRKRGLPEPKGLRIDCNNAVPTSSGLGSSATAVLLGLLAASALSNAPASCEEILNLAADMEGHSDNAAAALYGGLVVTFRQGSGWFARRFDLPTLQAVLVLPDLHLPTHVARDALPRQVTLSDAVFNIGRAALVVEAFQKGDLDLLGRVMEDRLHQPYRFKLIPGALDALAEARKAGAAAGALSGAGPSLIAFCPSDPATTDAVKAAMTGAFAAVNIQTRAFTLQSTSQGACTLEI
jgi:homoserine kinase